MESAHGGRLCDWKEASAVRPIKLPLPTTSLQTVLDLSSTCFCFCFLCLVFLLVLVYVMGFMMLSMEEKVVGESWRKILRRVFMLCVVAFSCCY